MKLKDLQQLNLERINRLRRVQRLLESEAFERAWSSVPTNKQQEIKGWLYLGNITLLEAWVTECNKLELETMSLRQLREEAVKNTVPYYCRLSKCELILEITNAREQREASGTNQHAKGSNGTIGSGLGQDFQNEVRQTLSFNTNYERLERAFEEFTTDHGSVSGITFGMGTVTRRTMADNIHIADESLA